ncbi:MAG: hypothetical protein ACTHJ6_10270 [Oryzihumus sp.]
MDTPTRRRPFVLAVALALGAGLCLPAVTPTAVADVPGGVSWSAPLQAGAVVTAAGSNPRAYAFASRPAGSSAPIARWNPCSGAIGYRVNLSHAPRGALHDVGGAAARIRAATGLRLVYQGTTRIIPGRSWQPAFPADTRMVIAWDLPSRNHLLSPALPGRPGITTVGAGGSLWVPGYRDRAGRPALAIIQGFVVLSATARLSAGFSLGPAYGLQGTRGQLLMHELGHAVGLDHPRVADRTEIMRPVLTRKLARWGAGDLVALRRVGASSGCLYPAG